MRVDTPADRPAPDSQPEHAPLTINREELLRDGSDLKFRELVHGLMALSARHQQVRAGHARVIGLTPSNYTVLVAAAHLGRRYGQILIREIAEHLQVTPTHVSVETNSLSKLGLLRKERSAEDSRVAAITITDKGWEALASLAPIQSRVNDIQFGGISAQEFDDLHRLVQQLVRNSDMAVELQRHIVAMEGQERTAADTDRKTASTHK
ncbi:MarR family winged helix-turn-helix transcriptional regulator [Rhodococcus sp. NPDC057529]|uniref:MarR family winged helix-turn-helix transcriptional regulator n=1 Tax=Rhodococcus sp. NPDC057529 TaxID=3346158 RepID=UPI0036722DAD